ncbi:MAG: YfhO family protein, partial [Chloroflexota bacterium]|nr:YfhO family protein [Chloroflexota bacterium]
AFAQVIDPLKNPTQRGWNDTTVDLSRWSGQRVTVSLVSDAASKDLPAGPSYVSTPILQLQDKPNQWATERLGTVTTIALDQPLRANNLAKQGPTFALSHLTIEDIGHNTLFMHANNAAELPVKLPEAPASLTFSIGMDPNVWLKDVVGDGVRFQVFVDDGMHETEVYSRYIDPKHNTVDRHWFDERVDLAQWRGQDVTLRFVTDGGPANDTLGDWAHWGDIRLTGTGVGLANFALARFELIYDGEIQVYRNNYSYPRAFVVHDAVTAQDAGDAIRLLTQSNFDPSSKAVIQGRLPTALLATTESQGASPAQILERSQNRIEITTTIDKPGVLIVSETNAPGWQVYVDNAPAQLLTVDVFLQGVYLPEGTHTITLVYLPTSFVLGATISITTLAILIAIVTASLILKRRRAPKKLVSEQDGREIGE